ncbi:MAG: GatB/YqeY domain-containing protein [Elusimicrobia bacterium]|nr:GatB/YqeY domain-containing protein [Elusimicrobiota bacterium]
MSDLLLKLKEDLKTYMRAKDALSLNAVRAVLAEISAREMKNIEISAEEIVRVVRSEIKKRKEAAETFLKAARADLVEKENFEITALKKYLPPEMTEAELSAKIKEIVNASADKTFGPVMKKVLAELQGLADGKTVSELLKKILGA